MNNTQDKYGNIILTPIDADTDVSDNIQCLIDSNPNKTIYFPDGIYSISKPIVTPANPKKSVNLLLSNYAVIKAMDSWKHTEAMIRLGGKEPANDICTNGSNYALTGGIIDGNGVATGISIDSGRETRIQNTSIKHTVIGIRIKEGANAKSSDADIMNVNIVGTGAEDTIGVLIEGFDNTLTNMRIANVFTGVKIYAAGNFLRNIHPLYTSDYTNYENSCGFLDAVGNNWFDMCYSDEFSVGFRNVNCAKSIYKGCFCFWYSSNGGTKTAFQTDDAFESIVTDMNIGFKDDSTDNAVLKVKKKGGSGVLNNIIVSESLVSDNQYKEYLTGKTISRE